MSFNNLVLFSLKEVFRQHNFRLSDEHTGYLQFRSSKLRITISHDDRDRSNALYIGLNATRSYPMNDNAIREVFNSSVTLNNLPVLDFINNLKEFFYGPGKPILQGDINLVEAFLRFVENEGREYEAKMLLNQKLIKINEAWKRGDYRNFLRLFDQLDKQRLPPSYQLKYKIALRKAMEK